jgi:mono/diheme cytochrome c family protein
MKNLLIVITVLLLSLTGCGGGVSEKEALSPAAVEASVVGEKIVGQAVVLFPTPIEEQDVQVKMVKTAAPTPTPAGDPIAGEKIFVSACAACHGQDIIHSEFIATRTDQELVEFIKVGGLPNEPLVMPSRGGNPSLTDKNLDDIAAYLRSLQK